MSAQQCSGKTIPVAFQHNSHGIWSGCTPTGHSGKTGAQRCARAIDHRSSIACVKTNQLDCLSQFKGPDVCNIFVPAPDLPSLWRKTGWAASPDPKIALYYHSITFRCLVYPKAPLGRPFGD